MSKKVEEETNVFLKDSNIIKCELSANVLKQFRVIFDQKLSSELFKKKKILEIEKIIRENLTDEVLSQYLIAVILNPVFNINYEEGNVLIVNYDKVGIFCYKPRHVDFSLPQNVQGFDKEEVAKMRKYADKVQIVEKENFENDKFVKEYLSAYYVKNYVKIDTDLDQFELKFVKDMKDALIIATGKGFWHIFLGDDILFDKDVSSSTSNIKGAMPKRESLLELTYQFDKNKLKKFIAISQQSQKPSFFSQNYFFIQTNPNFFIYYYYFSYIFNLLQMFFILFLLFLFYFNYCFDRTIKIGWKNFLAIAILFLILFLVLGCEEINVKKQAELDSQIKEYQQKMKILKEEQEESYFFSEEDNSEDKRNNFVPTISKKLLVMDGVCYLKSELLILCMIVVVSFYTLSLFRNRKIRR